MKSSSLAFLFLLTLFISAILRYGDRFVQPATIVAWAAVFGLALLFLLSFLSAVTDSLFRRAIRWLGFEPLYPPGTLSPLWIAGISFLLIPISRGGFWVAVFLLVSFVLFYATWLLIPRQVRSTETGLEVSPAYKEILPDVLDVFFRVWLTLFVTWGFVYFVFVILPDPLSYIVSPIAGVLSAQTGIQVILTEHPWLKPSLIHLGDRIKDSLNEPLELLFAVSLSFAMLIVLYLYVNDNSEIAAPVGGVAALIAGVIGMSARKDSWIREIAPELISISIGIIVIDQIYAARQQRQALQQEKRQFIYQLSSPTRDLALEALRHIRDNGWLHDGSLSGARLVGAQLSRVYLGEAQLARSNLSFADLSFADLSGVNLYGAHLQGANLEGAILFGADLRYTNLENANLRNAMLENATMIGSNLFFAQLDGARLGDSDLRYANLGLSSLQYAYYNSGTKWPNGVNYQASGAVLMDVVPLPTPYLPVLAPPMSTLQTIIQPRGSRFYAQPDSPLNRLAPPPELLVFPADTPTPLPIPTPFRAWALDSP